MIMVSKPLESAEFMHTYLEKLKFYCIVNFLNILTNYMDKENDKTKPLTEC